MNIKRNIIIIASVAIVSLVGSAAANQVTLTAKAEPIKLTYKIVHQNLGEQPVFSGLQSVTITDQVTIPVNLDGYALVGIVAVSVNGHELPSSVNQFDRPYQCSMTTNKKKSSGVLEFAMSPHKISCMTKGGIFG